MCIRDRVLAILPDALEDGLTQLELVAEDKRPGWARRLPGRASGGHADVELGAALAEEVVRELLEGLLGQPAEPVA
eukprot:11078503-Alexandrium_andersonii.AAC.1